MPPPAHPPSQIRVIILTIIVLILITSDLRQVFETVTSSISDTSSNQIQQPGNTRNRKSAGRSRRNEDDENAQTAQQLITSMKNQLTATMQEWCLPKLVCELHASQNERSHFSEAELGLFSIIKESSSLLLQSTTRYHFAAHMGQLLANVEGNGCHNFYPNCPLSGGNVMEMVKRVKLVRGSY